MPEPKGSDVRTIALRVSPAYHAQLALVAQIDEITLTDLMQRALDAYMAQRRAAPDFQARAQAALEAAEAITPCFSLQIKYLSASRCSCVIEVWKITR